MNGVQNVGWPLWKESDGKQLGRFTAVGDSDSLPPPPRGEVAGGGVGEGGAPPAEPEVRRADAGAGAGAAMFSAKELGKGGGRRRALWRERSKDTLDHWRNHDFALR
ncbi:hypothetical protein R5R35_003648 [Gryllus longicercus]|uniref:Uncharacterized protein n=1 Tax=Gryllus longicercus TaxID=2509291 RepID=A0AAN9VU37_9ORTH